MNRHRRDEDNAGLIAAVVAGALLGLLLILGSKHHDSAKAKEQVEAAVIETDRHNREVEIRRLAYEAQQLRQEQQLREAETRSQAEKYSYYRERTGNAPQSVPRSAAPSNPNVALDNANEALRIMGETRAMMTPPKAPVPRRSAPTDRTAPEWENPTCSSLRSERDLIESQMRRGFYHGQQYRDRLNSIWKALTERGCSLAR